MVIPLLLAACAEQGGTPSPTEKISTTLPNTSDSSTDSGADTESPNPTDSASDPDSPPPIPTDADADGWWTPEDCDDNNASVHPGVVGDDCDGVDEDCDGFAQGEGTCAGFQVIDTPPLGWWVGPREHDWFMVGAPLELEDGPVLRAISSTIDAPGLTESWGTVILLGGHPGDGTSWEDDTIGVWVSEPHLEHLGIAQGGGDFNGDGAADVWMVSTGSSGSTTGGAFLALGPSSRWPQQGAYVRDAADGWWVEIAPDFNFGRDWDTGKDIDGDGLMDFTVLASDHNVNNGTGGSLHVVLGRTETPPHGVSIGEEITLWQAEALELRTSFVRIGPDMDGDGSRELVLSNTTSPLIVRGDEVARLSEGQLGDWVELVDNTGADPWTVMLNEKGGDIGDWDGDGYGDTTLRIQFETGTWVYDTCLGVMSGGVLLSTLDLAAATGSMVCQTDWNSIHFAEGPDLDNDGVRDMSASWSGAFTDVRGEYHTQESASCVLPSSRLAAGGRVEAQEIGYCLVGSSAPLADLNGDGAPEMIGYACEEAFDDGLCATLLPGFEIPWGDASRW